MVVAGEEGIGDVVERFYYLLQGVELFARPVGKTVKLRDEAHHTEQLSDGVVEEELRELIDELPHIYQLYEGPNARLLVLEVSGVEVDGPEVAHPGDKLDQIVDGFGGNEDAQSVQVCAFDGDLSARPLERFDNETLPHERSFGRFLQRFNGRLEILDLVVEGLHHVDDGVGIHHNHHRHH